MSISMERDEQVFADSNYFIALSNPSDSLHQRAIEVSSRIDARETPLVISNFIFLEVVTVLARKRGGSAAEEAGAYLLSASFITRIHIDEWLQKETWEIFRNTASENISFVDCSVLAVMGTEGITKLLTFDMSDFRGLQRKYRFQFFEK